MNVEELELETEVIRWVMAPGYIREVEFSYNIVNHFTCDLREHDSQPEYYDSSLSAGFGHGLSLLAAFLRAKAKLHIIAVEEKH